MKKSALALPLSLALATSAMPTTDIKPDAYQDLRLKLPECALECIAKKAAELGCKLGDLYCQCNKLDAMSKLVAPCLVRSNCELSEITKAATVTAEICAADMKAHGYTIDIATSSGDRSKPTGESGNDDESNAGRTSWSLVGVIGAGLIGVIL